MSKQNLLSCGIGKYKKVFAVPTKGCPCFVATARKFEVVNLPISLASELSCQNQNLNRYWHTKERFFFLYAEDITQGKNIYLTFDDGPNPYSTPDILDVLDKHNVRAAFFLIGDNIKKYLYIVREIRRRGHIIGNHSFSHSMFFAFHSSKIQKLQAKKVEELLGSLGIAPCVYFRPPSAICNNKTLRALSDYKITGVNHWISDNTIFSAQSIVSRVLKSIRNKGGGIIVLHDGVHPLIASTRYILPKALDILIPKLLAKGYQFSTLDDIVYSKVLILPSIENNN